MKSYRVLTRKDGVPRVRNGRVLVEEIETCEPVPRSHATPEAAIRAMEAEALRASGWAVQTLQRMRNRRYRVEYR